MYIISPSVGKICLMFDGKVSRISPGLNSFNYNNNSLVPKIPPSPSHGFFFFFFFFGTLLLEVVA